MNQVSQNDEWIAADYTDMNNAERFERFFDAENDFICDDKDFELAKALLKDWSSYAFKFEQYAQFMSRYGQSYPIKPFFGVDGANFVVLARIVSNMDGTELYSRYQTFVENELNAESDGGGDSIYVNSITGDGS